MRHASTRSVMDGYLRSSWQGRPFPPLRQRGVGAFLCPSPGEVRAIAFGHRAPSYRGLMKDGSPVTWGFEMWNEPMISIFFPNPLRYRDEDTPEEEPVRGAGRLARDLKEMARPRAEALDGKGPGFGSKAEKK